MLGFTVALILLALVLQRYTLQNSFRGVTYRSRAGQPVVEPDEPFEIITQLDNTSRRFIPFVRMCEAIPSAARIVTPGVEQQMSPRDREQLMLSRIYLMPRQRLERRVSLCLGRRGCYTLRGATLEISDFLGLRDTVRTYRQASELVVVPPRHENDRVTTALAGFIGNASVRRFIMEDPVLTLGFREYTGHEPIKMISWAQTARRGELMVKSFDYTVDPTVTVLLNIQSSVPLSRLAPLIEICFSLTRTVCEHLERLHLPYGFMTNAHLGGVTADSQGKWRYLALLEGLGRAGYLTDESCEALLERAARHAQPGCSYIVITPYQADRNRLGRLDALSSGPVCLLSAEEVC